MMYVTHKPLFEFRLEAMTKMKTLKERSVKDERMFQAEMKVLQRMIVHDTKTKEFMDMKENERLRYKAQEAEKRARMSMYNIFICLLMKYYNTVSMIGLFNRFQRKDTL